MLLSLYFVSLFEPIKLYFSFADLPKGTLKIVFRGLIILVANPLYIIFFTVLKRKTIRH